jgi:release factor glutamine methyltransferase
MKVNEIYNLVKNRLEKISSEPETETLLILEKIFNISKLDLVLEREIEAGPEKMGTLENILLQREKRIPLQYIFKKQKFRNYDFFVDQRVLIPRPETEILVDKVIETAAGIAANPIRIVDIGCGSGAIAISLALEIENSVVYSVDISREALEVAAINQENLEVPANKLFLIMGDKLEVFRSVDIRFDILVSNPPYIPYTDYRQLDEEVKNNEPGLALIGKDEDGLGFYRYFAREAKNFLKPGGFLCFETGYGQASIITDILKSEGNFSHLERVKDYNNIERIVMARLNYENLTG